MKEVIISPEYIKQLGKEMQQAALAFIRPEQLLERLNAEQRLAGLNVEERLAGLETEVIEAYLQQRRQTSKQSDQKKKPVARRKPKPKTTSPTP